MLLTLEWIMFYRQGAYLFFLEDPFQFYDSIVGADSRRAVRRFDLLIGGADALAQVVDRGIRQAPTDLVRFETPRFRVLLPWIYTEAEVAACLKISPVHRKFSLETPPEFSGRVVTRYATRLNPFMSSKFATYASKKPRFDMSNTSRLPSAVEVAFARRVDADDVASTLSISSF